MLGMRWSAARVIATSAVPVILFLIVWEAIVALGLVREAILPAFSTTMDATLRLMGRDVWEHLGVSLYRAFAGLALAVALGSLVGVAMAMWRPVHTFFDPIITTTYAVPKPAIIPIAMLWLGVGTPAAVVVVFLGCLLPMVVNAYHGARGVNRHMLWSARAMGASRAGILWSVVIPAALPSILSGTRIALAFSFVLVIAAEQVASRVGIGGRILLYGHTGAYDFMFASILLVIIVAFVADVLLLGLTRWILRWQEGA